MLHSATIAIGILALLCGLIALVFAPFPPAFIFLLWGALIVAGTVFERFRYKANLTASPGPGWVRTSERFIDDETGKMVTVFVQPETGEREYVQE